MERRGWDANRSKQEEPEQEKQSNCTALGMCFGLLVGSVGMGVLALFGQIVWGGLVIGIGLLAGMLIGTVMSRKG